MMNLKSIPVVLLLGAYACSATYSPLSYTDRPCGSNLTNLWLDVVVLVDNSHGMTNSGLASIAANIANIFGAGTRIGTDPKEPRTTRIGLVTYNSQATVKADLNKFQSTDDLFSNVLNDLNSVSNTYDSYLEPALVAAYQLFQTATHDGFNRTHYQRVMLIYASTYQESGTDDPLPVAMRLKASGVDIITVAFEQDESINLAEKLAKVASPRMSFTNTQGSVVKNVQQALLEANCFCPYDWMQYRDIYNDVYSEPHGVCLQPNNLPAVWRAARSSCALTWPNSYLANEYTSAKHDFILNALKGDSGFSQPYTYLMGLNMNNGNWTWDQPNGWVQPTLQKWQNWAKGYPIASSSMGAGINKQSGLNTLWENVGFYNTAAPFVCETYTCDTDNYCASRGSYERLMNNV